MGTSGTSAQLLPCFPASCSKRNCTAAKLPSNDVFSNDGWECVSIPSGKMPALAMAAPKDYIIIHAIIYCHLHHMGVSKIRGSPKWMVYNGKPYFLMDDLGIPLFLETPIYCHLHHIH